MFGRRILAAVAFVAACARAQGQLTITDPSSTMWWVSGSVNTVAWSCSAVSYTDYTILLTSSNVDILAAPLALVANVPNADCSFSVNQQLSTQQPSNTYTILLANPQNSTDVYASSPFEIKANGSPYPVSSASASATGTASGAAASSTSASSKSGAAASNYIPVGMSMAAALVLGLVIA